MERRILAAFTRAADTSHAASLQPEPSRREELKAESLTLLNSALKLLDDCRNQRSNVTKGLAIRTAGEFLIIAAETCLKCNQPTLAHLTTKSYFAQPSLTTGPPTTSSDQYTCRALFILAQTTMQRSPSVPPPNDAALPADRSIENVNGAEKLRQTLQAVEYILKAIAIAQSSASSSPAAAQSKYAFIITNASIHFWNVTRPSQRPSTYKYLAPSLALVYNAVNSLPNTTRKDLMWLCQLGKALVLSLDAAGEFTAAAARVTDVVAVAKKLVDDETAKVTAASVAAKAASDETKAIIKAIRTASGDVPDDDDDPAAAPPPTESLPQLEDSLLLAERNQADLDGALKTAASFKADALTLTEETAKLRLHVARNQIVNADCKKLLDEAIKDETIFVNTEQAAMSITIQKLMSGIVDGKDEEEKMKNMTTILTTIIDSIVPPDPSDTTAPRELSLSLPLLNLLVDAGLVAARTTTPECSAIATRAADLCKSSKTGGNPAFRVKLDYLAVAVMASELDNTNSVTDDLPGASSNPAADKTKNSKAKSKLPPSKLDSRHVEALRLSRRVEALKLLDRTMMSARRLNSPALLEYGAVLAWNLGLPLLQPHLRKHVHRVFTLSSQVLAEIESPNTKLRAMLHLETAKCELASDFLAKAKQHVDDSIRQDYGTIDEDRVVEVYMTLDEAPFYPTLPVPTPDEVAVADAKNDVLRPFDRYTYPMHRKLILRTSIYSEPDNAEEKALLQLEQAKEVSDVGLQKTLLQKAAVLLEASELNAGADEDDESNAGDAAAPVANPATLDDVVDPENPLAVGDGTAMDAPSSSVKLRTSLWSEIAQIAWNLRAVELVKRASLPILSNVWSAENNREFVVMQVKCQLTLAEGLVESLKQMGLPPSPAQPDATSDDEPVHTSKRPDPRALGIPCSRGSLLSPPVDYADAADERKRQIVGAISAGITRATKLGGSAAYLVESGAVLLWNYHIHIFRNQAYADLMPEFVAALKNAHTSLTTTNSVDWALKASLSEALALISESEGDLNATEQYCTDTIAMGRPMQVKRLVEILARVKYSRGSKEVAPPLDTKSGQKSNTLFEVSAICVAIGQGYEKGDASVPERKEFLSKAIATLKQYRDDRIIRAADTAATVETTREEDEETLEFEAELWVRLASESLSQTLLRQAQFCCSCCVEQLPAQPEMRKRVPVSVWRWYSCAENVWGRAIAAMVNTDGQDRTLQDELRRAALKRLVTAARHGSRARQPNLVLQAVQYLWNIALPLTTSTISRKQIFPFIKAALSELSQAGVSKAPEFRVDLFILLFECYTDAEDWSGGLDAVNDAFIQIPAHLQRSLWQRRVVFMSKLGKSVLDGMQKMKESDPVLQARVWAILARAASSTKQQLTAYVQAIDSLEGRFERMEYCIEMAEWMIQTGLSKKDSNDVLMAAVDAFMAVEESAHPQLANGGDDEFDFEDELGDDDIDGNESMHSGFEQSAPNTASRSRLGTAPGTVLTRTGSRASMDAGHGDAPGAAISNAPTTSQGGLRGSTSRTSMRSRAASAASSATGDHKDKNEGAPEALNVAHMMTLIRSLAMLSKTSDGFRVRIETALSAAHYAERCLLLNVSAANDGAALAAYEELSDEDKLTAGGLTKFTNEFEVKYDTPAKIDLWVDFAVSGEFLLNSKNVPHARRGDVVSTTTVDKVPIVMTHLFYVADVLIEEGLTLQALPVLILAEFVANLGTTVVNENLVALCGCKLAIALSNIGKNDAAVNRLEVCGPFGLDEARIKHYKDDVEQIEIQHHGRVLTKGDKDSDANRVQFAQANGTVEDARKLKFKRFEMRHVWCGIAEEMIKLEQPNVAAQYLEESLRHCAAFEDRGCRAKCLLVKAKVNLLNGQTQTCVENCKSVMFTLQNLGGGESKIWADAALLMSSALSVPPLSARGEAKKVLASAYQVFKSRMNCVPEMMREGDDGNDAHGEIDLEVVSSYALIAMNYAGALAEESRENRKNGGPWMDVWNDSEEMLRTCTDDLARLCDGGGAAGGEGEDSVRPPQILVDVLEYRSTWVLRMGANKNSGADGNVDLDRAIDLLSQANRIALDNHAFASTPESAVEREGGEGEEEGGEEKKEGEVEGGSSGVEKITLPTARRAANVQIALCRLFMMAARANHEHVSTKEADEEYAKNVTDPVTKYLDATAPKVVTEGDVKMQNLQSALFFATSARRLAKFCPSTIAAANGVVGECLALLASQQGLLNAAWDVDMTVSASETSLGLGGLTPSASAADLAGGGKGGGKAGKGGGKGAKGGGGEEKEVEKFDFEKVDDEVEIDESGDIRSQSMSLLTAAGNSLAAMQRYGASLAAHVSACEVSGSAIGGEGNPVHALRSLLKAQAAGCNEWLSDIRMRSTEAEPTGRDRLFMRKVGRCERDRVDVGGYLEDAAFRSNVGGDHGAGSHAFPPIKASRAFMDKMSTPWQRITNEGGSGDNFVDDLLVCLPDDIRLVILQLSADMSGIYCGVASKGNMPAVGKVAFSKEEQEELGLLVGLMKNIEGSAFSKFMIRYGDEAGEEGNYVEKEGGEEEKREGIFIEDDGERDVREVVERMEVLFAGIMSKPQIVKALQEAEGRNAVVIPDVRIQLLPLEALGGLRGCASVSRDFSAQMFLSRISGWMKGGASGMKGMKYVVDPRAEDAGSENASKPRKTVEEVLEEIVGKGGPGGSWSGIAGKDRIASDGEWQNMLRGNEGEGGRSFMYYGPGRCLARFGVDKLSGLNVDGLNLVVLADRAENDGSYRRQSKLDNQKDGGRLGLEQSLETAALFSLAGANCVVLHRWAVDFRMLGEFVAGFSASLGSGKMVCEGLKEFKEKKLGGERGLKMRNKYNVLCVGLPQMSLQGGK